MADKYIPFGADSIPIKVTDNGDGSYSFAVSTTGGGSGGPDREIVVNHFRVTTAFTGASVNDVVTQLRVLDLTGDAPVQVGATIWFNDTTQLALASAPSAANLEPIGASGVTNTQLVAALATQTTSINGTVLTNAQVVAALATQTTALNAGTVATTVLLNAVTGTGAGATTANKASAKTYQAWGTVASGTGSATINIEGSNDTTHWDVIGTITLTLGTGATSDSFASNDRYLNVRANVTAVTGTTPAITVNVAR